MISRPRTVGILLAALAFCAVGAVGLRGWLGGAHEPPKDEVPLATGYLNRRSLLPFIGQGYPWDGLRDEVTMLRRDLPPLPEGESAEDREKDNRRALFDLDLDMPAGQVRWGDVLARLRTQLQPLGVKVLTPPPQPDDATEFTLPRQDWKCFLLLDFLMGATQRSLRFNVTADGLVIGSEEACGAAVLDAKLEDARRRVAPEHAAAVFDAPWRPDREDAPLTLVARDMKEQTGVEVIVDPLLWESGAVIKWRGEPRPLRDALDAICARFQSIWRWHNGRAYVLRVP